MAKWILGLAALCVACSSPSPDDSSGGDSFRHVQGPNSEHLKQLNLLLENTYQEGPPKYQIYGSVWETQKVRNCHVITSGACSLETCDEDLHDESLDPATRSAGLLTVTVGSNVLQMKQNVAYVDSADGLLWDTPGPIGVDFAGAQVPAVAETLQGPGQATLTNPLVPAAGTFDESTPNPVPRSKPFTLSWTGGWPGDELEAYLWWRDVTDDGHELGASLTCRFDAATGSGALPSELLEQMPKTGPEYPTWLNVRTLDERLLEPGNDYFATLRAVENARVAAGQFARFAMRLE